MPDIHIQVGSGTVHTITVNPALANYVVSEWGGAREFLIQCLRMARHKALEEHMTSFSDAERASAGTAAQSNIDAEQTAKETDLGDVT